MENTGKPGRFSQIGRRVNRKFKIANSCAKFGEKLAWAGKRSHQEIRNIRKVSKKLSRAKNAKDAKLPKNPLERRFFLFLTRRRKGTKDTKGERRCLSS